jgi:hypothetical protein
MSHRNRKFLISLASLFLACNLVLQANATTLVRMDLNTLAHSAEIIVRARCKHSETRWESETIWTFADFDVLETFKGAPPQTLRVRLPGGRISHTEVRIEGVPAFTAGEETVLFVEKTSAGDYGITSWAQGTFRIHHEKSGDARITQDTSHFAVFDPNTRQFSTVGVRNLPMSDFRIHLANALANPPTETQLHSGSKP